MKRFKSLNGQRLGQAIYNALYRECNGKSDFYVPIIAVNIIERLFYIEDDELIKLIKKEVKEVSSEQPRTT